MEKKRNPQRDLVGKPKGKRLLRRSRHRWEDNSKSDLKEMALDIADCIHLAHDRYKWWGVVNTTGGPFGCVK